MKLSEDLAKWRCERPDEWTMDRFIKRAEDLEDCIEAIAEMKIPYCDANDVAHNMRDLAKEALTE